MPRIILILLISIFGFIKTYGLTLDESAATNKLVSLGFENVKVKKQGNILYAAIEDNIYRGSYRGLGVAIESLITQQDNTQNDTLILVALENLIPRITLTAIHSVNGWNINTEYGGEKAMKNLKHVKKTNNSLGKVDIVVHPRVTMTNYIYSQTWEAAIDLAPSIEVDLWKGAKATVQVALPIWNNYVRDNSYGCVRPGYMTLSQKLLSNNKFDATISAGIFSQNRNGVDLRGMFHINKSLDLGFIAGYTGGWYVESGKWNFCELDKLNYCIKADYYEHYSNCQIQLMAGQFVYGDMGARIDISRHLAEFNLGVFGTLSKGETDTGFFLSIPLGTRKMPKHRYARVRLPESFSWEHNMFNYGKYLKNHQGVSYKTASNQDNGDKYWQPQYIKEYVVKYLNGQVK